MRVIIGPPLRQPPKHQIVTDSPIPMFPSMDSISVDINSEYSGGASHEGNFIRPEGLSDCVIFCTNDFSTVSKEVDVRTRKVRLIGLQVSLSNIMICISVLLFFLFSFLFIYLYIFTFCVVLKGMTSGLCRVLEKLLFLRQ